MGDARRDFREHVFFQDLEYASVAEEPGDGDVAAVIEGAPLRLIGLKPTAVGRKVVKSEFVDSPRQALADLTAHFAKAGPVQIALRQGPLEKGGAIAIVHRMPITAACGPLVCSSAVGRPAQ
jgi:hypothetical protein